MGTLKWARWFAWITSGIAIATVVVAIYFHDDAANLIQQHEQVFKLVGLGIGPFLAVISIAWGRVDKFELKALAEDLGRAK